MTLRWRLILVGATVALLGYFASSPFVNQDTRASHWFWPDSTLRLGLDLQGGIHWVLGVKLDVAEEHELDFLAGTVLTGDFEEQEVAFERVERDGDAVVVETSDEDLARVKERVIEVANLELLSEEGNVLVYGLTDDWRREVRERGMRQVLEVMRRRIEDPQTGVPESVVTRQGTDRILVQIPGGDIERGRARQLLDQTGFLEFKIVQDVDRSEELLAARYPDGLPEGTQIVFQYDRVSKRQIFAYLVPDKPDITGDYLKYANVGFDNRSRPIVNFTWKPAGAEIFGELTGENIDNQLAIVVDNQVYSAPAIRSRIQTRGQIEGQFTPEEAAELSIILRAGALSVPVVIEEERTVGPALGADSVSRGLNASIVGLLLVVVFTFAYYRMSGGFASIALFANLIMIVGLMAMFGATLTMPGIAGLVLTVGMAVDANVIIFERIREELRAGKIPRAAVSTGFSKATWTILDANITTLITAIVLYEFGTGPIKGFAVTLSIGILTSVFAAMVITRLMFALYPGNRPVQELSI